MKWIFYLSSAILIILYIIITSNHPLKDPQIAHWIEETPKTLEIKDTSVKFLFSVDIPSSIYWRIYDKQHDNISPSTLTNPELLFDALAWGGNSTTSINSSYTNFITNLQANQEYYLYTIPVSSIGTFPKELTIIPFKTLSK